MKPLSNTMRLIFQNFYHIPNYIPEKDAHVNIYSVIERAFIAELRTHSYIPAPTKI